MAITTHLHIGPRKTGSTFIQGTLWQNNATLTEHGILLPFGVRRSHAAATRDLLGLAPRVPPEEANSWRWSQLVKEVNDHPGRVLFSDEGLAAAGRKRATSVVHSIEGELHVVATARPLDALLTSAWQQSIKERKTHTLGEFLAKIADPADKLNFWHANDVSRVVDAWAGQLPAERIHLVTMPRSTEDPALLWQRFAQAVSLQQIPVLPKGTPSNRSLGAVGTEVLRRFNSGLSAQELQFPHPYRDVVRISLTNRIASSGERKRVAIPPEWRNWVAEQSNRIKESLAQADITLHGNLEDLSPLQEPEAAVSSVTEPEVSKVLIHTLIRTVVDYENS